MGEAAKILLVEDEALNSMYLRDQLERMGFRVETMTAGEAAVGFDPVDPPDLILMDINLSGDMSGLEAARQIKARADIPLIFTTGYSDERIRELAAALDPVAFLVKPLSIQELRRWMLTRLPDPASGT